MMEIIQSIQDAIRFLYRVDFSPELSPAPKAELGEYATNVFPLTKELWLPPNVIAESLSRELSKRDEIFRDANATGGYVNFFLTNLFWQRLLYSALQDSAVRTSTQSEVDTTRNTIIVDYFAANIGKPLHIGHLCTPSIGQTLMNVYKFLGYNTLWDNHLWDWGWHFGKLITGYKKYGSEKLLEHDAVEHLLDVYVKITADAELDENIAEECRNAFKKLSEWDTESIRYWEIFTKNTLSKANAVISFLDVHPTYAIGESFYEWLQLPKLWNHPDLTYTMHSVVEEIREKWIATRNEDGSIGITFPEDTKLPSCMLVKRDGTHGYLASDLACMKYRLTNGWDPNIIAICTDVRQSLHFKQLFWIALSTWPELLQQVELVHVPNGFIRLKEWAMSTRKWNIIRLEDLIQEWYVRTKNILKGKNRTLSLSDTEAIAISAIKYSYLSQDRERDITFDWDKALNFEGNSWPYIQYAYVRAKKILDEALKQNIWSTFPISMEICRTDTWDRELWSREHEDGILREKESIMVHNYREIHATPWNNAREENIALSQYDKSLIQKLLSFYGSVEMVAKTYKPHHLAIYSYELAVALNAFYVHTPKILEENDKFLQHFRLALLSEAVHTIATAFDLLAMRIPSEM